MSGTGYTPNAIVTVAAGSGSATVQSGAQGAFTLAFQIYSGTNGPQTVTASDPQGHAASTKVQLTVSATPAPTAQPSVAPTATAAVTPRPSATAAPIASATAVAPTSSPTGTTINPGQLKSGPARTGSITVDAAHPLVGGSVDLRGGNITIRDDGVVDGVDIYNGTSSSGAVYIGGDRATIKNSVIRNSGDAGVLLNSDGSRGQKSAVITDNAFRDLGDDAIHVKGTNRGDGQAPSYDMAQAGHYIARNSSTRTGTKDSTRSWSFEIQDGCQDIVMEDNWADNTYSIVGHTNLTFRRNTSIATTQPWGFEFGNMRGSLWEGNVARTSGRFFEAFGFTGLSSESNVGNTLRGNAFHHADNALPLALGHNNNFYDNCFDDVSRWMYSKYQYNASADVVVNQKGCP